MDFAFNGVAGTILCASLASSAANPAEITWDARAAEHLVNRAGFGAGAAEIAELVAMGRDAAIESLFPDPRSVKQPIILAQGTLHHDLESPRDRHTTVEERRVGYLRMQPDTVVPMNKYGEWWVERMIAGDDPLRDHMTIFWHGHFVSAFKEVASSEEMIAQIQFLRNNALGPFETLVSGIGRDPAMLEYLDNASNVKGHPNENWARELMELFTLGDGNYTETDIKESARAFTGWSDEEHQFAYHRLDHDFGQKTVLGVTGNLDGDHITEILLRQPACGRFLSTKLITFFEGVHPTPQRVDDYAQFLRDNQYDIGKFLRRLFKDPEFYRDEVRGTRVAAPIEYLVGVSRRTGIHPPGQLVTALGAVLGQRLFWPPSVKGWEGGMSWINTASLMHRSNMAGILLGLVDIQSLMQDDEFDTGSMSADGKSKKGKNKSRTVGFNLIQFVQNSGWEPDYSVIEAIRSASCGTSDREIVECMLGQWLAVPYDDASAAKLSSFLREGREQLGAREGELLSQGEAAEVLLRRLAHLVQSLPEAQLN